MRTVMMKKVLIGLRFHFTPGCLVQLPIRMEEGRKQSMNEESSKIQLISHIIIIIALVITYGNVYDVSWLT